MSEQNLLNNAYRQRDQKRGLMLDLQKHKKGLKWILLVLLAEIALLFYVESTARIVLAVFASVTFGVLLRRVGACVKIALDLNEIRYHEMIKLLKNIEQVKQSHNLNEDNRYKSENLLENESVNFYLKEDEAQTKGQWSFGTPIGKHGEHRLYDWIETPDGKFFFWGLASFGSNFKANKEHLFFGSAKYVLKHEGTEKV